MLRVKLLYFHSIVVHSLVLPIKTFQEYTCGIETLISPVFQRFQENSTETVYSHVLPICVTVLRVCFSGNYNLNPFTSSFKSYLSSYNLKIVTHLSFIIITIFVITIIIVTLYLFVRVT